MRTIVLALAAVVGAAAPARADVLPQFVGVPDNYLPNTPFSFELRVPGLTAFMDFNLDLIVQTTSLDPVTLMRVTVDRPADADYPFGAAGSFSTSQSAFPASNQFTVHIEGAAVGAGVSTTAGGNDLLATVTVTPGPNLSDPIRFSLDAVSLRLDALPESGRNFQPPDPVTVFPDLPEPPPPVGTPAPAGVVLIGIGGLVLPARKRIARRA